MYHQSPVGSKDELNETHNCTHVKLQDPRKPRATVNMLQTEHKDQLYPC